MKIGYICGVVSATTALVSYVIFVLCVDVLGVDVISKIVIYLSGLLCFCLSSRSLRRFGGYSL